MTTFAHSGRPAWAITAWVDDNNVFVELPCKDGPPYITKHPLTEAGLSKALGTMRDLHRKSGTASYMLTNHPKIKRASPGFSDKQREAARGILKRMKIRDTR